MNPIIKARIKDALDVKSKMLQDEDMLIRVDGISQACIKALNKGNKIMFCGNGGSAVDSMHLAAEFTGRYYKDRKPLNAEALSADNAFITAVGNDYGFEHIFSRMVRGKGKDGDILFGLSTSGNSANVVEAFKVCRELGIVTIGFTGANECNMDDLSDILIKIPSTDTPRIQEGHMLLGHTICEIVELAFL